MRPPDHNIFVDNVEKNSDAIVAIVSQVGKNISTVCVGERVIVQRGKNVLLRFEGKDYVSVPEHFILARL